MRQLIRYLSENLAESGIAATKAALWLQTLWLQRRAFWMQVAVVMFLFEYGQYWMRHSQDDVLTRSNIATA